MSKRSKEMERKDSIAQSVSGLSLKETEDAIWKTRHEIESLNYIYDDATEKKFIREFRTMQYKREMLEYELERISTALKLMPKEAVCDAYPMAVAKTQEMVESIHELEKIINSCKGNEKRYAAKQLDKLVERQCSLNELLGGLRDHKAQLEEKTLRSEFSEKTGLEFELLKQIKLLGFLPCSNSF